MKHKCVVLADSHINLLEGLRGLLDTEFESVVMVADLQSLFEVTDKLQPDIAIIDLSLSVSDDNNIVHQMKRRFPKFPFIILSVHDEADVVNEVMTAGAAGFVLKRTAALDLLPAVDTVLQSHNYISPSAKDITIFSQI
ncbi:MAG: response regulator transcription factor [bacterium]|nr:response regulator transcription factor [bacterium]